MELLQSCTKPLVYEQTKHVSLVPQGKFHKGPIGFSRTTDSWPLESLLKFLVSVPWRGMLSQTSVVTSLEQHDGNGRTLYVCQWVDVQYVPRLVWLLPALFAEVWGLTVWWWAGWGDLGTVGSSCLFTGPCGTRVQAYHSVTDARGRYQLEIFSVLLALYVGNSPVTGEFPSQRPATRSFDVFFHLCLNKRLSKQLWGW